MQLVEPQLLAALNLFSKDTQASDVKITPIAVDFAAVYSLGGGVCW